jgi:hypothetical protein
MMFLAENDGLAFGGFLAGIIGLGALMLALCWIVFPFIVVGKFNSLIREVRSLRAELKTKKEENAPAKRDPTPNAQRPVSAKKAEPTVYKID